MTPAAVAFIGAVHEARPALDVLMGSPLVSVGVVVTCPPDAPRLSGFVDLTTPAEEAGVPVVHTTNANEPRVVEAVRSCRPELLVVVGWTQLIGDELLAVPGRGCVGFHASLLPRHRGRSPVNWAILRGEKVTGNTMMMLAPGADTGDIVDQVPITITESDTCATVYDRVGQAGAAMLTKHLPGLLDGSAPRRAQEHGASDVLPRRTPEMGVIDWDRGSDALHDWIRALTAPYPGAFTTLDGEKVMVWAGEPWRVNKDAAGPPGEILGVVDDGVLVATGDGVLCLSSMSVPGGAPCHARTWADTVGARPGMRFGRVTRSLGLWSRGEGPEPEGTS